MNYNRVELYNLLKSKQFLKKGTRGTVFINNENTLIKIPNEIDCFNDYETYISSLRDLYYKNALLKESEFNQKKFMKIGKRLEFTDFAQDLIYLDNTYIGVILKWYKNYNNLENYNYSNDKELIEIFKYLIECNSSLIRKGIYHFDLLFSNILYNGKDIKIIDIDGEAITYSHDYNLLYEHYSYESLFIGLEYLLDLMFKDLEYIYRKRSYCNIVLSNKYKVIDKSTAKKMIKRIDKEGIFKK